MFSTASTSSTYQWLFSLKIVLISASMLSMAVILKLSAPAVTDFFLYDIPYIHTFLISWLRPPYLYLVINCIIISIVASSKLQQKLEDPAPVPATALEMIALPPALKITDDVRTDYGGGGGVVLNGYGYNYSNEIMNVVAKIVPDQVHAVDHVRGGVEVESVISDRMEKIQKKTYHEKPVMVRNGQDDEGVSRSMWNNTLQRNESVESILFSNETEKPPPSSRFGHRKTMKASPEGKALRVLKPKRHDTLENTWKTMTDGRSMPLTRHLKKSDTWEPHVRRNSSEEEDQSKGMKKSETFSDARSNGNSLLRREPSLGGSGRLKREPSLSQDELNRRVEAFINKVNEDMRLQRQESLNQYMEMIGRGAS